MFLVLKRFPMDEVPIALVHTISLALIYIGEDSTKNKHATLEQQNIMKCDIGLPFCDAYLIVEFDNIGKPINSQIINTGD